MNETYVKLLIPIVFLFALLFCLIKFRERENVSENAKIAIGIGMCIISLTIVILLYVVLYAVCGIM